MNSIPNQHSSGQTNTNLVPPQARVPSDWPPGYMPPGVQKMVPPGYAPPPQLVRDDEDVLVANVLEEDEPVALWVDDVKPHGAFTRVWRKIGAGSLLLSIVVHAALIALAGMVYLTVKSREVAVDFLPGVPSKASTEASANIEYKVSSRRRASLNNSVPRAAVLNENTETFLPEIEAQGISVPDVSGGVGDKISGLGVGAYGVGSVGGPGIRDRFTPMHPSIAARCSPAERMDKLRKSGGSAECEIAVSKSLAWLKTKQNEDGSWGRTNKAAMTGLSLLCYLGRCETPDSPFYGDNVMRGILYLVELSKRNEWGIIAEDPRKSSATYEHGIATYALGEMYAFARLGGKSLPGMKDAFERGVALIIENQLADGGWGYGEGGEYCYRRAGRGDLSVTGWQYQALKAATNTSLKIDKLSKSTERAVDYLTMMQTKDGGFGNTNREAGYNQWNLSGCGLLGLQTLGKSTKKAVMSKGVNFIADFVTAEPLDWNRNCNLYSWYYMTQSMFQEGGAAWKMYNAQFLPQILSNQAADGAWKIERANSPIASSTSAGADREVYRQVLCTLMLEVYYRYLKVADREDDSFFER